MMTTGEDETRHIILIGDSIFDNAAYVAGGPDVVRQLTDRLPQGSRASLLAVDGAVVNGVVRQVGRIPPDATHLVVSAGGNDALGASGVLGEGVRSVAERRSGGSPRSARSPRKATTPCWTACSRSGCRRRSAPSTTPTIPNPNGGSS